jgi:hypothetical protein
MPVTGFGSSSIARSSGSAAPAASAPASVAPMPSSEAVGHGVTRLKAYTRPTPFIPGTPPPRGETAGAHGAHKGRISVR